MTLQNMYSLQAELVYPAYPKNVHILDVHFRILMYYTAEGTEISLRSKVSKSDLSTNRGLTVDLSQLESERKGRS